MVEYSHGGICYYSSGPYCNFNMPGRYKSGSQDLPTRLRKLAKEMEEVVALLDACDWMISFDNNIIESLRYTATELEKDRS